MFRFNLTEITKKITLEQFQQPLQDILTGLANSQNQHAEMVHTHDVFSVVAYVAVSYTTHKYNTTSTPKAVILLCRSAHKPDAAVPVTSDV